MYSNTIRSGLTPPNRKSCLFLKNTWSFVAKEIQAPTRPPPERLLTGDRRTGLRRHRQRIPRLSRIFSNKIIKRYPAFDEFYGMEEAIEQIVSFFRHAAQGLEERKQILYLLGPVGGGKSSLAEKLKDLMQRAPYLRNLKDSPINESPLGPVLAEQKTRKILEEDYGIPRRYLKGIMSPWAAKRMKEYRRRHQHSFASSSSHAEHPGPDCGRQNGARRRKQPGHLRSGRQGRHTQAGDSTSRAIRTHTATPARSVRPTRA